MGSSPRNNTLLIKQEEIETENNMGDANEGRRSLSTHQIPIQSKGHEELLNIIDSLRSQGISRYIDLPQIIVCGDQSSGKSSVLEGVSLLKFPTKDALCTRFATELILRRSPDVTDTVSIVPDPARTDDEKARLSAYRSEKSVYDDFGAIIEDVSKEMGLEGSTKVFSTDVLRIELTGPNQPHLTLVDLPGLFHAGSKTQSDADADAVRSLVTSYMQKSRSIILAVVSAKNDYNNQIVTKYARDYDPQGERTMGIITKPDTLPAGSDSEKLFFELAENKDVKFKLGWHVLKNRDYETRDSTNTERDEAETKFFSKGIWTSLSPNQMGIASLRPRLSRVLQNQILTQLPSLIADVESGVRECDVRLALLGRSRDTAKKQLIYLHDVAKDFCKLIEDAVGGNYGDEFFGSSETGDGYAKRIRAVVANSLDSFARDIQIKGHEIEVDDDVFTKDGIDDSKTPIKMTMDARLKKISLMLRRNRGTELPGFAKSDTIKTLFRQQSTPWATLSQQCLEQIFASVRYVVLLVLDQTSDSTTRDNILRYIINPGLEHLKNQLDQQLKIALKQHVSGHPITFNHYFTENIQKLRAEHKNDMLASRIEDFFGKDPRSDDYITSSQMVNVRNLLENLADSTEADMDRFGCSENLYFMEAYYKVALKFFVDDFSIHTIEQGLMEKLTTIFEPTSILSLDPDTVTAVAGETEESSMERASSEGKRAELVKALDILYRLDRGQARMSGPEIKPEF